MSHFIGVIWSLFLFILSIMMIMRFFHACGVLDELNITMRNMEKDLRELRNHMAEQKNNQPEAEKHNG